MRRNAWITGMAVALAAGLMVANPVSARAEETIPVGVHVGGLDLSGLTVTEAQQTVQEYIDAKLNQSVTLHVNGTPAKTSAGELGLSWKNPDAVTEAIEGSEVKGNLIRRYMKEKDLQENPLHVELELGVDQAKVNEIVQSQCAEALTTAQDAVLTRADGAFVITPSVTGVALDAAATEEALNAALLADGTEEVTVDAVVTKEEPRITTEAVSQIQDVLGTYTTGFASSGWARSTNLEIGASKINGRVLMPGEVLSGYECMAPITAANGYKNATAYENGRSVDSIGGGVCQIATTLYNAALYAELDIVQRQNHSMTVSYVDHSRDAAIAGTYKDIKVANPYDTPIYVEGYTSGKKLTFTIYGKETRPANREIKFESKTLQWISPGPDIEQVDPTLAPGQRVREQSAHTGIRSELYKCVYVDGELQEKTLLNKDSYNASKAIYRVGPPAPPPVEQPVAAQPEGPAVDPATGAPTSPAPITPAPAETAPSGPASDPALAPGATEGP